MKKIFAIILLISFFIQVAGYHILFFVKKLELKAAMKQQLKSNLANKSVTEFIFEHAVSPVSENTDEFSYKGEMYDVISVEKKGSHFFVQCINDKKEDELLKNYSLFLQKHGKPTSKKQIEIIKLLQLNYISTSYNNLQQIVFPTSEIICFIDLNFVTISEDVLKPPPQV